jgi:UDP-N-acetylglucosamine 2-epimerase (non-hydrolysing)
VDVMLLVGTKAEAVKVAPLALALGGHGVLRAVIVHGGRHDGMVEQALAPFRLLVDVWLDIPPHPTDRQAELVSSLLPTLDDVFRRHRPAALVVQGDSTMVLAGALAAFWAGIPVVHLDAEPRAYEVAAPLPEEGTRQMVTRIAALHLAPTAGTAAALRAEGVPRQRITIVGNTVVDAVVHLAERDLPARCPELALLEMEVNEAGQRLIMVTVDRGRSWGEPLNRTLAAVRRLVEEHDNMQVLFPSPPNPVVRDQILGSVGDLARVAVTEPLDYPDLVRALRLATVVLTDSDDIQEEAPAFSTPVLLLRDATDHEEALDAGYAWLVGTDPDTIYSATTEVLAGRLEAPASGNPYSDGRAAARTVIALEDLLGIAEGHFPASVPASEP